IGTVPVLVAIIAAVWHRTVARPLAWAGFALSLAGVGLVTGGRGGGAGAAGGALVLAALGPSAAFPGAHAPLPAGRRAIGRDGGPGSRAHGPACSSWVPPWPCCRSRRPPRAGRPCPAPPARSWPPRPWRQAARCCPSPCSPTRRAGCRPR